MKELLSVKVLPYLRINLLLFPVIAASLIWDYFGLLILSYTCALLHEMVHIWAAVKLGVGISYIELQPFGVCARLKADIIKNPLHEVIIAILGPVCSLVLCLIGYYVDVFSKHFVYCNLALAIVNLLPVLPLDGGRVLRAVLTMKMGAVSAYNTTVKISRIPIATLIALSVYGLLTAQFNFSVILIGVFLLGSLFAEQHNISRQAIRELTNYKQKLKNSELSHATVICGDARTPARKILRRLSYNRYHIIHITDDNMRVTKTLTEGQILDAINTRGIRTTLGEI